MASFPVPVNNNLNQNNTQTPIAGVGVEGSLGGVRVDGTSIEVDPDTGVISVKGSGGGVIEGGGTPGFIPEFTAAQTIGDSPLDDGVTLPGTVTTNEPFAVYPTNPPGGLCVDIEVANITTPQTGEFDLVYITDSAPATTFETNVLLELDAAGTGTVGNQALHITNGLAAGGTNFAIKSDSPAKSVFAGEVQVPDLLLTPGSAPGALTDGQVWYDSTTHQIKARVNGATIVLGQGLVNITSFLTITGGTVSGGYINVTGGASSLDIQGIPAGFLNLILKGVGKCSATDVEALNLIFNNDSGTNYGNAFVYAPSNNSPNGANGAIAAASMNIGDLSGSSNPGPGIFEVKIMGYANTSFQKMCNIEPSFWFSGSSFVQRGAGMGAWKSTAAINRITLTPASGTFVTGTQFSLFAE